MSWTEQCCRWSITYAACLWLYSNPPPFYGRGDWLGKCEAYARAIGLPA